MAVTRALAAAGLVLAAGCGAGRDAAAPAPTSTPPADGRYATVEALHEAMVAGGAGCTFDRVHHDILPGIDDLTCFATGPGSDGTRYVLAVWRTPEISRDAIQALTADAPRVQGANWFVAFLLGDEHQPERVRRALGGTIHR